MESTRKIGQDKYFLKILIFRSTFVQKSTFGNWTFAQFLSFEWRNGSQNRNVLEKLSGTGPFWKFWLFGQGQGSTWSKHFLFPSFLFNFFFFFFFYRRFGPGQVSRSVRVNPGRSGQMGQTVVGGDVMDDITTLDACGTCARVAHVHVWHVWHVCALAPTVWRVCARELWWRRVYYAANVMAARGGAWWLRCWWFFLGFVHQSP